jgi:hypothetical protein
MSESNKLFMIGIVVVVAALLYYFFVYSKKENFESPAPVSKKMKEKDEESGDMDSDVEGEKVMNSSDNTQMEATMTETFQNENDVQMDEQQGGNKQLTAQDLLPHDNSSQWAQVYPSGDGSLKDRNFLQAGYHIGINTVGQTLRNANLQLRSEPPCPQVKVSPWIQSTIEPDLGRKPFEIGGCA